MSKYDFMLQIEQILKARPEIGGASVRSHIYMRNNDTEFYGVTIFHNPKEVSPIFFVDGFYEEYCKKKLTLEESADLILSSYKEIESERNEHSEIKLNFEDCRDRIIFRLVSRDRNKKGLKNVPHIEFLDMAIIFAVVYSISDSKVETMKITYDIMEDWGKQTGDLLGLARINTPRIFPMVVKSLSDVLGADDVEFDTLLLSNKYFVYGATIMLYEDDMKRIAEVLEEDFYVVPSSVHELLLLPKSRVDDVSPINEMIASINEEHLVSTDILSDKVYLYDHNEKRFYF